MNAGNPHGIDYMKRLYKMKIHLIPSHQLHLLMLANVIVFELFKHVADDSYREKEAQFFLLNYETLEGTWHSFIKHPLATDESFTIDTIENLSEKLEHRYG